MRLKRNVQIAIASAVVALLQACGGGGGGSSAEPPPPGSGAPAQNTYGNGSLPGRLLVNAPDGRDARLINLVTAEQKRLPQSANATYDEWSVNHSGRILLRWTADAGSASYPVAQFDASSLAAVGTPVTVPDLLGLSELKLSADGLWLLAQYGDNFRLDRQLTVLDANTMAVKKRGSQLNGADIIGDPQAWLPDGRYLYLLANELWVSSPTSATSELVARLALPPNGADLVSYVAGQGSLAVSQDGSKIAFTWRVRRGNNTDTHVFTARANGTELRQMTAVADASSPLSYSFGSPTWSPDGQWLAFVLYMSGTSTAPVWPQDDFGGSKVTGTTGCDASPLYVLPASQAQPQTFGWPTLTKDFAVKARSLAGANGEWVTSCSTVRWLP